MSSTEDSIDNKTSMGIIVLWVKQSLINNLTRKCPKIAVTVIGRCLGL